MSSALTSRGSTRAWRRLRALRLELDGHTCRFFDPATGRECGAFATHVHHVAGRAAAEEQLGAGVDALELLASACARHNLAKGAEPGLEIPTPAADRRKPNRWDW